ncbi:MAG: alanine:cation symporter family protein, partial [Candidatus Methanomethylophilaceae archaeon]|nr:alanine:cation symporter family protein [Candidatus Methanomethylophilaceae archaeon]
LISDYNVSETSMRFISDNQRMIKALRIIAPAIVFICCLVATKSMFAISDVIMGIIALCNIPIMFKLSGRAMEAYRDYRQQRSDGIEEPVFHKSALSDTTGVTEWDD